MQILIAKIVKYICVINASIFIQIYLKIIKTYNLEKNIEEIFFGLCQENNHFIKLEYFCKTHNKLCCSSCIAKVKREGNCQHTDCDVCTIEDIKETKKNQLKENIKILEDLYSFFEQAINQLNEIL